MTPQTPFPLEELQAAIRAECAADGGGRNRTCHIDGIESLPVTPGRYRYRVVLGGDQRFSPDQEITFRHGRECIPATVLSSDDQGVVVESEVALPADAVLRTIEFDPRFILNALDDFLTTAAARIPPVAELLLNRCIPALAPSIPIDDDRLNDDQRNAVAAMSGTQLYFLWGPPGTGKTTTLGVAIARWMRRGCRVLVVSTSNAAVDTAVRALLRRITDAERASVLRLGSSTDPEIQPLTPEGRWQTLHPAESARVRQAQTRLQALQGELANRNLRDDQRQQLYAQIQPLARQIEEFNRGLHAVPPPRPAEVSVVASTLARMVLSRELREQQFDVVVLDEASMVSQAYALAASLLARNTFVIAGDHEQLPPIVQAENNRHALEWFGQNVYDRFGITGASESQVPQVHLLRSQHRMTNEIGSLVSDLTYAGRLTHWRNVSGPRVQFIDIGDEWQTNYWSRSERSYYHIAAAPLLHSLAPVIQEKQLLLLAPYRAQRSLLSAIAMGLEQRNPALQVRASTIHRAQGSEADAVVVDLTTYAGNRPAAFFGDANSARLMNVAMSRARSPHHHWESRAGWRVGSRSVLVSVPRQPRFDRRNRFVCFTAGAFAQLSAPTRDSTHRR